MKNTQQDIRLLPNNFKKVAIAIILLCVLVMTAVGFELLTVDKEAVKTIVRSTVLISLLILILSRDKVEDELTLRIRLKAFATSFIYGAVMVVLDPFFNLLFEGSLLNEKGATELLISMFIFYFIIRFIMNKKR